MNYRILLLAIGTFAIGMEGFMIAGLLPAIAKDFNISLSIAGQLVTVFSIAFAIGSPILTTTTASLDRRKVLFWSLLLFATGNILCGIATNYWIEMVFRVVTALGAGIFSPAATLTASKLVKPEMRGRAISIVVSGLTISLVLGVPLGIWIASLSSWRWTFWIVGGVSLIAALFIRLFFPTVPVTEQAISIMKRLLFLKRPSILSSLMITLTWSIGIYTVYTYISDIFGRVGATEQTIALMLFICGIGSFLGVTFGGYSADRFGAVKTMFFALTLLFIANTALSFFQTITLGIAAMALFGFSGFTFNPAQQHRLIGISKKDSGVVLSLHSSFIYLGSGLGSLFGGLELKYGSVTNLGLISGGSVLIAILFVWLSIRFMKKTAETHLSQ
ncbi:Predicted arabinose efflux permease, MFS family [Seinonella peptonophila]|uniref:Predicted arabinose efflux permease, MFS family n=1 Tax=Seinonella peptonophila TaxID=112248 RepID=A0A1M4TYM1_9BACL|nr:MFS transporter [Seinonella peptonophila]SHE49612.1 Predicted arabinose efflux permease, MFS family [Seinonella peptonophila]